MTALDVPAPTAAAEVLDLSPAPGRAPAGRMLLAQGRLELALLLRNGEQVLLALVIPALLLAVGSEVHVVDLAAGVRRVDAVTPGVLALAAMSIAFTGQAIATGFERRYGVLKRLGSTPLPRWGLLGGKTLAVLAVEALQLVVLGGLGLALGWHPHGDPLSVLALLVVGTAAFTALALLLAGTLRAEATLAAANLVWVLLLLAGGVVVPLSDYPSGAADAVRLLPLAALAEGLRDVLEHGRVVPWRDLLTLGAWAAGAGALAGRWFRWE
ncbi:ABC-2 type transport system permease protein [Motilibacter rhizosphaerae]|uniref:ABC-2 type transport system permease protein n=1 Tax=Motilibacter rhizosphaerae TaxID=598652 RepID=A0A4Q7NG93_9ACTN|nr:ABC transporter permease [Motilibacter rhizosphaerae]RZS82804.1 ABC-2 type transport system permease protein [Motilibacter rhizosphaerae]